MRRTSTRPYNETRNTKKCGFKMETVVVRAAPGKIWLGCGVKAHAHIRKNAVGRSAGLSNGIFYFKPGRLTHRSKCAVATFSTYRHITVS